MDHNQVSALSRKIVVGLLGISEDAIPPDPWDSVIFDFAVKASSEGLDERDINWQFSERARQVIKDNTMTGKLFADYQKDVVLFNERDIFFIGGENANYHIGDLVLTITLYDQLLPNPKKRIDYTLLYYLATLSSVRKQGQRFLDAFEITTDARHGSVDYTRGFDRSGRAHLLASPDEKRFISLRVYSNGAEEVVRATRICQGLRSFTIGPGMRKEILIHHDKDKYYARDRFIALLSLRRSHRLYSTITLHTAGIIAAIVRLKDEEGKLLREQELELGRVQFRNIPDGKYSIEVELG